MGYKTGITWTDHTYNHWWGCTEVTSACDFCYAREWAARMKGMSWGKCAERILIKGAARNLKKWDRKARESGVMKKVFAHSMSDIFDLEVSDEWRYDEFELFRNTTNLWFQFLTKRPAIAAYAYWNYPAEKVWMGTSLGGDFDLPLANKIVEAPARLHWISYEPAIAPLNVLALPSEISWVVIGGESGKNARPFYLEWALKAIEDCRKRNISVFIKQLGRRPFMNGKPYQVSDSHGKILDEWPKELRIQEFPI